MSQQTHDDTNQDQDGPPSLADVVRQATDNGLVIANFYSDVIQGKLDDEGFEACHKMEAAMQVHAIAPEVVAGAIERLTGVECHPERRGKRPNRSNRPSRQANRSSSKDLACPVHHAGNPYPAEGQQALEYLADALAAPSLADDPRVTGIVRGSTDHGKSVVSFLLHVMYGNMRGFRPNNRMEAANELIGHIARDELRTQGLLTEVPADSQPTHAADQDAIPVVPAKADTQDDGDPTVVPAQAGTQRGGDGSVNPALSAAESTKTVRPEPVEEPALSLPKGQCSAERPPSPSTPTVVPAKAGTQRGGAGRGSHTPSPSTGEGRGEGASPAASTKPETQKRPDSTVVPAKAETQKSAAGSKTVRPEPVEEPALSLPKGQCSTERPPSPSTPSVVPAKAGTQRGGGRSGSSPSPSTGEGRGEGDSPARAGIFEEPEPVSPPGGVDRSPITIEELERFDFTRDHIALYNFARDEITGGIYGYDDLGPVAADEYGVHRIAPSRVVGYERAIQRPPLAVVEDSPRSSPGRSPPKIWV